MTAEVTNALARARRSADAARVLASNGFHGEAISRAYFAAFYAAEAALLSLGETRSKHSGVVSGFGELVVRRAGFDVSAGKVLASLFDRRNQADYGTAAVPEAPALTAIADAERFVAAVDEWLGDRPGS